MHKKHTLAPSILSLALGLGAASAAQAGMQTYTCQFGTDTQAKLVMDYDTTTGRFGLVDYFGTPSLPSGMQVEAFNANAALLGFTLNAFTNGTLTEASTYRFDFISGQASLVRYTMQNAPVTVAGNCVAGTVQAGTPTTAPTTAPAPVNPAPVNPAPVNPAPINPVPASPPPAIPASSVSTENSYHCRFEGRNQTGMTFDFSSQSGAFTLTDYYGSATLRISPNGGFGSQLGAVNAAGATVEFTVEDTSGTEVIGGDTYAINTDTLAARDTSFEISDDGSRLDLETRTGSCTRIANSGQSAEQAAVEAIAQAMQAPAPAFTNFTSRPRQNTICARDDRPTSNYTAATWCVSTAASPQGEASFGPKSLLNPDDAWCTSDAAWGLNDTVEISFEGLAAGSYMRGVALVNGASLESAEYFSHSRPSRIVLDGETGGYMWQQLEDRPSYQAIAFAEPLYSDWIRLTIADVFPAMDANHNACINQIVVDFGQ